MVPGKKSAVRAFFFRVGITATALVAHIYGGGCSWAQEPEEKSAREVAQRILASLDVVLDNHLASPTLQQMVLTGVVSIGEGEGDGLQTKFAREISELSGRDGLVNYLEKELTRMRSSPAVSWEPIETMFLASVLESVERGFHSAQLHAHAGNYIPRKQYTVEQQLRENRYVGIGIALAMHEDRPVMAQVYPRGPAHQHGGLKGDVIESIDGEEVKGWKLEQVVDKLRGREGEPVSVVVRQPGATETRELNITRGEVPFDTVVGKKQDAQFHWEYAVEPESDIAYLRIESIRGSTARELKEAAKKIHASKFRAVILDLQKTQSGDLRHAAMIADQLLGTATIGMMSKHGDRQVFKSDEDNLFAGWPMCVLVGTMTHGQAEWIAAALQDQKRAVVVGIATPGHAYYGEAFPVDGGGALMLTTGKLLRGNGQPLVSDVGQSNYHQAIMMQGIMTQGVLPRARRGQPYQGMPGAGDAAIEWKPGEGWRGIKPDVMHASAETTAIALLKAQISSEERSER